MYLAPACMLLSYTVITLAMFCIYTFMMDTRRNFRIGGGQPQKDP